MLIGIDARSSSFNVNVIRFDGLIRPRQRLFGSLDSRLCSMRGELLIGKYGHWCNEWDGLPIDETCMEWPSDIDKRDGSDYLCEPLKQLGLRRISTSPFADLAFTGRGNDDAPIEVGIEFKKLDDLVTSLRSGRLQGHQLPGMLGPQVHMILASCSLKVTGARIRLAC